MHLLEPALICLLPALFLARPHFYINVPHLLALFFLGLAILNFLHVPALAVTSPYGADKRLVVLIFAFMAFFSSTWLADFTGNPSSFLVMILLASLPLYGIALAQAVNLSLPTFLEGVETHQLQAVTGRLRGPFPWPVNFGLYLLNLLAVALTCWLLGKQWWHRFAGCLLTIATMLALIGSGTRSALGIALLLFIISCFITRRALLLCCSLLLTSVILMIWHADILTLFIRDEASLTNRLLLWGETWRLICLHPWYGIGLQQFPAYYEQLTVGANTRLGFLGIHPHQQYLTWAVEGGILWCLAGIALLISILIKCGCIYFSSDTGFKGLQLAAMLAIFAAICAGFIDNPLDPLENVCFVFLLAGLAVRQKQRTFIKHGDGMGE